MQISVHPRESAALITRFALQQCFRFERLWAVLGTERERGAFVHRHPSVFSLGIENVEVDAEVWQTSAVQESLLHRVVLDSIQNFHARNFRIRAASQLFDDHKGTEIEEVGFAASRRTGSADCAVNIKACAEDRLVA